MARHFPRNIGLDSTPTSLVKSRPLRHGAFCLRHFRGYAMLALSLMGQPDVYAVYTSYTVAVYRGSKFVGRLANLDIVDASSHFDVLCCRWRQYGIFIIGLTDCGKAVLLMSRRQPSQVKRKDSV